MKLRMVVGAAMVGGVMLVGAPAMADEAPATAPAAAVAPPSEAASASTSTSTSTTADAPAASKRTVWPWIIMGSGVALIATGDRSGGQRGPAGRQARVRRIKLTGLELAERPPSGRRSTTRSRTTTTPRRAAVPRRSSSARWASSRWRAAWSSGSSKAARAPRRPRPQPVGKPRPTFTAGAEPELRRREPRPLVLKPSLSP